jgi:arginine decarboxylase
MELDDPLKKHAHEAGQVHANPSQLRLDMWSRIRLAADRLAAVDDSSEAELKEIVTNSLGIVQPWARYFAFPGRDAVAQVRHLLDAGDYQVLAATMGRLDDLLIALGDAAAVLNDPMDLSAPIDELISQGREKHYFTVALVDSLTSQALRGLESDLRAARTHEDEFVYELLQLESVEDALAAVISNPEIQALWVRGDIPLRSDKPLELLRQRTDLLARMEAEKGLHLHGPMLAEVVKDLRPEIDLYLTVESEGSLGTPEDQALFNRAFYRSEHPAEIHMATMDGVRRRYQTPFFDALKKYARRPIGNFHALPIARGNSVFNSKWIADMGEFYGDQIFMAETSSTVGGLDSLLAPTGSIRQALDAASRAFGSKETYFATNGTSSSNKIVLQALCRPGDVVLIDRNCHKSHHYGLVLSGAHPIYLDAYPIAPLAIYGAVPTRSIKEQLLDLKAAGELDRVRMTLLTNCTFDGIVYHPLQVMKEILAIKPDMVFLWDEAWFAFAQLHPTYRRRTAMWAAAELRRELDSPEYREEYNAWKTAFDELDQEDPAIWLDHKLMADPDLAKVRVYATQSTHKSLSALRQGSMIHQWDELFTSEVEQPFHEAYFTHTTTSPNYQIVASLDLARRQVELEGYAKISNAVQMAMEVRERVNDDPELHKYFNFLGPSEMIPEEYRESGLQHYVEESIHRDLSFIAQAWRTDEFVLDPTRLTLYLANTGMTGDEFKVGALMNEYGIQVNKTATNTVLLMTSIGTTWSAIDYLLQALRGVSTRITSDRKSASEPERRLLDKKVDKLTNQLPPLPDFSKFHDAFRPVPKTREGDMRSAFFLAYDTKNLDYVTLTEAKEEIAAGRELVSSAFIIPYPPGFPILVPGQVLSLEIVDFLDALAIDEIHGYHSELGLPIFTASALAGVNKRVMEQR